MEQQKAVASQMATRYRQASKKKRSQIIKEYMGLTGCTRHHAAWLRRCWGTTVWDRQDGNWSRSWSASVADADRRTGSTMHRPSRL